MLDLAATAPAKSDDAAPQLPLDVAIRSIATAVPEHRIEQQQALSEALGYLPDFERSKALFQRAGINQRYSVVPIDWHRGAQGWESRADVFAREAGALLEEVSRKAMDAAGVAPDEIAAIVTVSTTGIAVPGLDVMMANRLGLPPHVERLPIFGLGCAGGVSGLARAARMAATMPGQPILFLAVELCTVNFRSGDGSKGNFVSTALFADGAAGLVIESPGAATDEPHEKPALAILRATGEHFWPASEEVMGWSIENDGFGVVISHRIPQIARDNLRPATDAFLARHGLSLDDIEGLVFHPGGRKVVEGIQQALNVGDDELRHSIDVLADYGNMSSPTVLFVLERTLKSGVKGRHLMGAFGPGFTVALGVLDI